MGCVLDKVGVDVAVSFSEVISEYVKKIINSEASL